VFFSTLGKCFSSDEENLQLDVENQAAGQTIKMFLIQWKPFNVITLVHCENIALTD
jgi:hypothetical protein